MITAFSKKARVFLRKSKTYYNQSQRLACWNPKKIFTMPILENNLTSTVPFNAKACYQLVIK
jgi:hypothetical protein